MRAEDRQVMLFRVNELMITVLPQLDLSEADGSTVGSCTSEHAHFCGMSLDVFELTPYAHIDPPYLHELRVLLDHALARSRVVRPGGLPVEELESRMKPHRLQDIETLEKGLRGALEELGGRRAELERFMEENPGWAPAKADGDPQSNP